MTMCLITSGTAAFVFVLSVGTACVVSPILLSPLTASNQAACSSSVFDVFSIKHFAATDHE